MKTFNDNAAYVMKLKNYQSFKYLALYRDGKFYSFCVRRINEPFVESDFDEIRRARCNFDVARFLGDVYDDRWSYRLYKGGLL